MPVPVRIDFVPPQEPDIAALRIFEGPTKNGPFSQIERITAIGSYPNYISYYTTQNGVSLNDWYAIQWETTGGVLSPLSQATQPGSENAVTELLSRMLLRDPSLNEGVAKQEAEGVLALYFQVADPYTIDKSTITPDQWTGLTLLAMARSYIFTDLVGSSGSEDSYVAGLVQQKVSSSTSGGNRNVGEWLDFANKLLGTNITLVMLLEQVQIAGGLADSAQLVAIDHSRLIAEYE